MPFKKINWLGLICLAAVLLLWEFSARSSPLLRLYFPPISDIVRALFDSIVSRALVDHLLATFARFLVGYFLSAVAAVTIGVVLGYFRFVYNLVEIVIEFLRPMPSVAMIPV